jgi:hypothetical protein
MNFSTLQHFAPDYFAVIRHRPVPGFEIHDGGKTGPVLGLEKLGYNLFWSQA